MESTTPWRAPGGQLCGRENAALPHALERVQNGELGKALQQAFHDCETEFIQIAGREGLRTAPRPW